MDRIKKRFGELDKMGQKVLASITKEPTRVPSRVQFEGPTQYRETTKTSCDDGLRVEWETSVKALLARVFGENDATYQEFLDRAKDHKSSIPIRIRRLQAVFLSAKDQFDGGHLFNFRNLVHADVFSDELGQAKYFLDGAHKIPAAVIAGTVLETSLRELCNQHPDISPSDRISKMNDDLTRAGVYNKMLADQVRAWGKIRNSAAHGKPEEFENGDVERMIDGIRDFIAKQMN